MKISVCDVCRQEFGISETVLSVNVTAKRWLWRGGLRKSVTLDLCEWCQAAIAQVSGAERAREMGD